MPTTVASAQVALTPSTTGFAQRLRTQLRQVQTDIGDVQVNIVPKVKASAYRAVTRDLDRLARDRMVYFTASADTRVAAEDLALLSRERRTRVVADADVGAADAELARLTRDRTVRITPHVSVPQGSGAGGADAGLGSLVSLAPALIPVAAYLGSIAVSMSAAAVSAGALGLAVAPQVSMFKDLSSAQDKAADAASQYGKTSTQAADAQNAVIRTLDGMPKATQRAGVAFLGLKSDFKSWSDGLAKFTMVPVEHGLAVVDALLPKTTPLVKGASQQFDRLITLLAGGVNSGAFDGLFSRFTTFANGALKHGVDDVVHFARVVSEGKADGAVTQFIAYAEAQGPKVRETLKDIAQAVSNILQGAAEAGPGMLTLVDDVAKLAAALPPSAVARALELYTAFKLIKLASSGITTVSGRVQTLSARLTALRGASTAAGGGIRGVRTALSTLSTGTKVAGAIAVIAGVAYAIKSLQGAGKAAPDIDKMTTAVGQLGRTGKASGELVRVYGDDLNSLTDAFEYMNKGITNNSIVQGLDKVSSGFGLFGKGPIEKAKDKINDFDDSLADLVKNGNADLAAAAVDRMSKKWKAAGLPADDFTKKLDNYKSAVEDAKFAQDLAADSMGLFGKQAQSVQKKLDTQKASADGLRGAIQALNDTYRSALGADSDFEQAIDDATKAVKGHHAALHMVNGQLDLSTQKAREAFGPLNDLAAKTDAAAAAARDNGASWGTVNGIYEKGRQALVRSATQMGLTTAEAKRLADQILKTPDKTARIKGDVEDLKLKIATAKKQISSLPSKKTTKIKGDASQLKNVIRDAQARINAMTGKNIIIHATTYYDSKGKAHQGFHEGGDYGTKRAMGGILPGYTPGRDVHHFTSPTAGRLHLSGGEAVMRPEWTRAVGPAFVNAMNALSRTQGAAAVRRAMGFKDGGILAGSFAEGGVLPSSPTPITVPSPTDLLPRVNPVVIRVEREHAEAHGPSQVVFNATTTDKPTRQAVLDALHDYTALYGPQIAV
jgi:hypothetical protein